MNPIILAIKNLLSEKVDTESAVVNLMVNVRKTLDGDRKADATMDLRTLRLHCDWLLHTELTGPEAKRHVDIVNRYQQLIDESMEATFAFAADASLYASLSEVQFMSFDGFRKELGAFFKRHGIQTNTVDDENEWIDFLRQYILCLRSSPLQLTKPSPAQPVRELMVSLLDYKPLGTGSPRLTFMWEWIKDGEPASFRRVLSI